MEWVYAKILDIVKIRNALTHFPCQEFILVYNIFCKCNLGNYFYYLLFISEMCLKEYNYYWISCFKSVILFYLKMKIYILCGQFNNAFLVLKKGRSYLIYESVLIS